MLQAIRDKAHGIFAWAMLILVGIPFALWGINNYFEGGKEKPVAIVGDRDLFERDVNRVYENMVARLGTSDFDDKQVRHEALEQIINDELVTQNAHKAGLTVSEADIRSFIQTQPFFQNEGKYDVERVKSILAAQGMSSAQFAAQVAKQLVDEQYIRGITDTDIITQKQLEGFYRLRNQERSVDYFQVPVKKYTGEVADKDIEAYYEQNRNQYRNPDKISVEYLSLTLDDVSKDQQVTEEDLKALYEEQKAQYTTPEKRKVSHILINADTDNEEALKAAQTKAEQARERIMKGEDFAKVAKALSDDKDSAAKGGDLGFVNKESLDPNFANSAFALANGEVSQPVKTSFGFHIIKVTELIPGSSKSFEEVKAELTQNFKRTSSENKFYEAKQKLDELSFEHNDGLDQVAKALNMKVETTGLFTRDAGDGVMADSTLRASAFSNEVMEGKNSAAIEIGNDKVYVLHIKEHHPATDKPLSEVKATIADQLKFLRTQQDTKQFASQLRDQIKQGKPIAEVAKSAGATVNKSVVKLTGQSNLSPSLIKAINKAPIPAQGKSTPHLTTLDDGTQVVFVLTEVKDGALASVDPKELEMAKQYILKNSSQTELHAALELLREKTGVQTFERDKQD